jgi:hypothetical protein
MATAATATLQAIFGAGRREKVSGKPCRGDVLSATYACAEPL